MKSIDLVGKKDPKGPDQTYHPTLESTWTSKTFFACSDRPRRVHDFGDAQA